MVSVVLVLCSCGKEMYFGEDYLKFLYSNGFVCWFLRQLVFFIMKDLGIVMNSLVKMFVQRGK